MKPLAERIYDGDRAKEVLENEAFQAVFGDIEQELIEAWKTSPQRDEEGRQRIFQALTALGKVKTCLITRLETGTLARLDLQHEQSLLEKAKAYLS